MRILEGLQSTVPSISQCSTLWIKILSETKQLSKVLLPLYNLITDVTPPKRLPQYESPRTPKPFLAHAQYYFGSAILKEDEPVEEDMPPYPLFYFTQIVDAPRLQYGLSLFLSLLAINPVAICTHLASAYMDHRSGYSSPVNVTTDSPSIHYNADIGKASDSSNNPRSSRPQRLHSSVAKSLLELVLTHCSHILLTDYSVKLDVTVSDITALTNIKITAANLLVDILECITTVVSGVNRPVCTNGSNLVNSTYILCLLALCEVQKSTLLGLLQMVDIFKNSLSSKNTESQLNIKEEKNYSGSYSLHVSLPHLQPLFIQLLKALYYGICLESMATNIADSPMSLKKSKRDQHLLDEKKIHSYVPGTSIVMQPLFFYILNSILSRSHLVLQQTYLLSVIVHSMLHFRESLEIIVPKILKQMYRNLKELLTERDNTKHHSISSDHVDKPDLASPVKLDLAHVKPDSEHTKKSSNDSGASWDNNDSQVLKVCQADELIALYMCTISHIVHYCLLRSYSKELHFPTKRKTEESVLHFQLTDPLWSLPTFYLPAKNAESSSGSPMQTVPVTQEKTGFSFGWLFGGVFNGYNDTEHDKNTDSKPEYCGVYAPVGQKVLWQLQHVYGVVVRVWKESLSTGGSINASLNNVSKTW